MLRNNDPLLCWDCGWLKTCLCVTYYLPKFVQGCERRARPQNVEACCELSNSGTTPHPNKVAGHCYEMLDPWLLFKVAFSVASHYAEVG